MHICLVKKPPCMLFLMLQLETLSAKHPKLLNLKRQHVSTCPTEVEILMLPSLAPRNLCIAGSIDSPVNIWSSPYLVRLQFNYCVIFQLDSLK